METVVDTIVDGLFYSFVTLGPISITACSGGTAAEEVAVNRDKELQACGRHTRNSVLAGSPLGAGPVQPPQVFIRPFDRNRFGSSFAPSLGHDGTGFPLKQS